MSYSVVVATYNRASLLKKTLKSLARQDIPKNEYEVLVINDGSTDETEEIITAFKNTHPDLNLIYLTQENRGVAAARNLGTGHAKGHVVFFTDDDCVVPPDWISTLAKAYERHPEVAGAGGWYQYPEEKNEKSWFVNYTMHSLYKMYGERMKTEEINNNFFLRNPSGNTSNTSYRKAILEEAGFFDERLNFVGLVDWELKKRIMDLGYPLLYIPFNVLHLKPLGFKEILRKFFNRGRGRYYLVKKNPELLPFYAPYLLKTIHKIKNDMAGEKLALKFMALAELLATRLGWEYQKWAMHKAASIV